MVRKKVMEPLNGKVNKIKSSSMMEIGQKTNKKAMENFILMIILYNMKVFGKMEKKMEKAYSDGVKVGGSNVIL